MLKVFTVYDKIADRFDFVSTDINSASWIRSNVRFLSQTRPLCDLELYEIGNFDETNGIIQFTEKSKVDWKDYKYPETKAEQLSPIITDNDTISNESKDN